MSFRFAKLNIYTHGLYGNTSNTKSTDSFTQWFARAVQARHSKQIITTYTKRVCIFLLLLLFVSFSFGSWPIAQLFIDICVQVWVYGIHCGIRCVLRTPLCSSNFKCRCMCSWIGSYTVEFNENLTVNNRSIAHSKRHAHSRIVYRVLAVHRQYAQEAFWRENC